ncbi:unnamed protein product, partial [Prunus brigantina]
PPPLTKAKRLRKKVVSESEEVGKPVAAPTTTTETDEELREAFDVVEREKEVEKDGTGGELVVVTSPLKPMIMAMPLHSVPGSSTTTSFADPELVEFKAMDLEAQLQKLEKLGATPNKAKSKAVDEAVSRIRIWQSAELDLDGNKEIID